MTLQLLSRGLAIVPIMLLVACAAPVTEPDQSGFLSDYSNMKRAEDNQWLYAAGKVGAYSKFRIEPVTMLFTQKKDDPEFTQEELEELKTYLVVQMTKRLTENDGYEVVDDAGPGVATFRMGINDVDATIGALNVAIYTKVTGAGLGGVSAEGEIVDSVTGEQLAAAIRWGTGSRVLRAGFTKLGDAKIVIDRWCKDIRQRIDQAHERAE